MVQGLLELTLEKRANIRERLDGALSNLCWRELLEHVEVQQLPRSHSNDHPILINCEKVVNGNREVCITWVLEVF